MEYGNERRIKDRKGVGIGTYMGFMGVRISTKEGKGFCVIGLWYIINN